MNSTKKTYTLVSKTKDVFKCEITEEDYLAYKNGEIEMYELEEKYDIFAWVYDSEIVESEIEIS